MALLNLIFGGPRRAQVGTMLIDASMQENHKRTAKVTESEIEDGSNIADHVKLEPIRLDIEGVVSDTKVGFFQPALGGSQESQFGSRLLQAGTGFAVTSGTAAVGNAFGGGGSLAGGLAAQAAALGIGSLAKLVGGETATFKDNFKYLEELWFNREPFTVVTVLDIYRDMIIEDLDVPRSANIGESLRFRMSLKQVKIVESSFIKVPPFQTENQGGTSRSKQGKQESKTPKDETGNDASILHNIFTGAISSGIL